MVLLIGGVALVVVVSWFLAEYGEPLRVRVHFDNGQVMQARKMTGDTIFLSGKVSSVPTTGTCFYIEKERTQDLP